MKGAIIGTVAALAVTAFLADAGMAEHPILLEAHRLALAGVTDDAVTEYKRYLFFNPDSAATDVFLSMAESYRDQGRLEDAQDALRSALASAETDSLRDAIRIEFSILDMARGRFAAAQMDLLRLASFSKTSTARTSANRFLCVGYILSGDPSEARKISAAGAASGDTLLRQLDSLLGKIPRYSRKSPRMAKIMSGVLPGLGQVYAHDLAGGLNALAISVLTGFMTVHSILYGYYQEAIFTDVTLFWRYYSGNLWNATRAAEKYNERRDRLFFNLVIDKILPVRYLK